MAPYDVDFFVVGGGSGGVRAARIAATHGARVALAEERYLGGTCVNAGCVPKKLLAYAAHYAQDFGDAAGFGWSAPEPQHDWPRLIAAKDAEIGRLNGVYRRLLEGAGVEVIEQRAVLADAHTLVLGDRRVTAETILIATGGQPERDDAPGVRDFAITSDEAFHLDRLPKRVVVAGGGYIAVEFAGIFHGLGAKVTQLYRGTLFLRGFDDDIRESLAAQMSGAGIDLRFNTVITRIERAGDCLLVHLSDGRFIEADAVMYAIGRRPNSAGLGLEAVGVTTDALGAIKVDADHRTSVANIYAVGDVTNRINLTPIATAEGHALADTLFGGRPRRVDYSHVPTAVFSSPPIATVGLTEAAARRQCTAVDIYRTTFKPMKHALSGRDSRTVMKLVVERPSQRVVGCHMLGDDAPEIVQGLAIALNCGATKADFDRTIGIHPTAAEEFVTLRTRLPDPDEVPAAAE